MDRWPASLLRGTFTCGALSTTGAVRVASETGGGSAGTGSFALPTLVPQFLQKFLPSSTCVPQCVQNMKLTSNDSPWRENFAEGIEHKALLSIEC
jgi:hypothetical protein